MVGIVAGTGLGLVRSSGSLLGSAGILGQSALGRGGDNVYLNAGTGNLLIQNTDEVLLGVGADDRLTRTYNSLGAFGGPFGAGQGWAESASRKVGAVTGAVNTAGSSVTFTDWDGSDLVFTYDASANGGSGGYTAKEDGGAFALLTFDATANKWTYRNGDRSIIDTFDGANSGRILTSADTSGNALTFTYDPTTGLLTKVTTQDGEYTSLNYNSLKQLVSISTFRHTDAAGTSALTGLTRVYYSYDSAGRLSTVTVDLSPEDNSTLDGKVYATTYGYDGTSTRIASISETDGSSLSIGYTLVGGTYRVTSLTQVAASGVTRRTSIAYDTTNLVTTITDPQSNATALAYDSSGRLLSITAPPAVSGGTAQVTRFTYDSKGDVLTVTAPDGASITRTYDSSGNVVRQQDALGNVITRIYGSNNQLLSETRWLVPNFAPAGANFDTQKLGSGYVYNPVVPGVSFLGYSGIAGNGSAFGLPPAPDGSQVGFIQTYQGTAGSISLSLSGLTAGTAYTSDFYLALRPNFAANPITVSFNGTVLGTFTPTSNGWVHFTTPSFVPTGTTGTLTFTGGPSSGDIDTGIDNIQVTPSNVPGALAGPPATTRYVYDSANRLRFTVGALGDVTEYRYSAAGLLVSTLRYTASSFNVSTLATTDTLTEATLASWASGVDQTTIERTDTAYDFRGNVSSVTTYSRTLSSGAGDTTSDVISTLFVYDQFGNLLKRQPVGQPQNGTAAETFVYDGLGRAISSTDLNGVVTNVQFNDSQSTTTVTLANGLTKSSTYDLAGELVAYSESDSNVAASTTNYKYDGDGRLRSVTDPTAKTSYSLYDKASRKTADIAPDGSLTEYVYNSANLVVETIRYATKLTAAQLSSLVDANGNPLDVAVASVRPPADALNDRYQWEIYDTDHRLIETIDASGAVAVFAYDGKSRLISTTRYANRIDANTLAGFKGTPPVAPVTPTADAANDRTSRSFYDAEDRLVGNLDGEGFLTRINYDHAGEKSETVAYATAVSAGLRASGAFADLVANVTSTVNPADIHNWLLYDDRGLVRASIDGEGEVTRYHYDPLGNLDQKITGQKLDPASLIATPPTLASLPAPSGPAIETTSFTYNLYGQVLTQTLAVGGVNRVTVYSYDSLRRLTSTTVASGTSDAATETVRYDDRGRVTGRLDGIGSAALAALGAGATQAQVNAIYATYGTTYVYDTADRLIQTIAPDGSGAGGLKSLFYYDPNGRLVYSIDPLGNVTEYKYDSFGERTDALQHVKALSSATLAGLGGGLVDANITSAVQAIADPTDADSHADFNVLGEVADTKDPLQATTSFIYNAFGEVAYSTAPFGATGSVQTSRTYDRRGLLATSTGDSASGGLALAVTNSYDAFGRLILTTDAANRSRALAYDRAGRLVQSQLDPNPNGQKLTASSVYDANGNVVATIDPNGAITRYVYDSSDRQIFAVDATGDVVATTYDNQGRVASSRRYVAAIAAATLNGFGTTIAATDVTNNVAPSSADLVTTFSYDADGRVITKSVANPTGANLVTTNTYDKRGLLVATTDPSGGITRFVYDGDGHQIFAVDATGRVTGTTWDSLGRVIATRVFGTIIAAQTFSTLPLQLAVTDVTNNVAASAADEVTNFVYDADGHLRYEVDAAGRVCEYAYDPAGNLIRKTEYVTPIAAAASYSLSSVQGQITASPNDRTTQTIFDPLGRIAFVIDAQGDVTGFGYDGSGNATKTTQFAAIYSGASGPSLATLQSWASSNAGPTDHITRSLFDSAGHKIFSVDAEGYVTQFGYDNAGRVTQQLRYPASYSVTDSATVASLQAQLPPSPPSDAQILSFAYDGAGRLIDSFDGAGVRTHYAYDGEGRATDVTLAFGTGDAVTTHTVYDAAGRVSSVTRAFGAPEASTTSYDYDAAGRVKVIHDALGHTTTFAYDAAGRVTTKTVQIGASTNAVTITDYDAFGNVARITDPNGNAGYFYYDKLNRQILEIDPAGYATATAYSRGDQAISVTHYVNATSGAAIGAPPAITTDPKDAVTSFGRDRLDRLTSTTDAEGFFETYVLDAFGNRVSVTNKLGGVTTNVFDRRGLLKSETLPINSVRTDGTLEASSVTNTYSYDARGNLLTKVEASGLTEQRTTTYAYDKADRLISTIGDTVQAFQSGALNSATAANAPVSETAQGVAPTETRKYDGRGNLIEVDDANGARTLHWYDGLNRKIATLDGVGTLRTFSYDGNGNVLKSRIYGDAVAAPAAAGGTPPAPVNANNFRETTNSYDFANRLISTSTGPVLTGAWNGSSFSTASVSLVTTYVYDQAGNLVKTTNPNGNSTYSWFDKRGKKIAGLDADGFLTTYALDQDGNVLTETRFATIWSGAVSPSAPPAVQSSANDRITKFTYDRNGRRLTEARQNVVSYSVSSSGALTQNASTTATITYAYNRLGEVTRKTEATGDVTDYGYDAGGRLATEVDAAITDFATNASVRRQTSYGYDGLNNVTRTGISSSSGSAPTDRYTLYSYGAGGRLASVTDAAGFTKNYAYDAVGNTVGISYNRVHSDGTSSQEAQVYSFDALGRATSQGIAVFNGTNWVVGDRTQIAYDAYGEIVSRGIDGGAQETYAYDGAGRLWRSTQGDGIAKLYVSDANGNQTLSITSAGADLSTYASLSQAFAAFTNNGAHTIDSAAISGVDLTINVYDPRNSLIEVRQPFRELSTNSTGVTSTALIDTSKTYNAFGEVTSQYDAKGNVTRFVYNTLGKIVQRVSPTTHATDETGAVTQVTPTENDYYDASGRLVGVTDANGHSTTRQLLAGTGYGGSDAKVLAEFHADGGVKRTGFDVYGDARTQTNELGFVENFTYDGLDRLTEEDHAVRSDGTRLRDFYSYDNFGQRITHSNNQFFASDGVTHRFETTDYDAQGRVTSAIDFASHITSYSYSYSSTLKTNGLGTFGGWIKTTTNSGNLTSLEYDDYFNRVAGRADFGGHNFTYTYDIAGRLTQLTNSVGAKYVYAYFNTGQLANLSDQSAWQGGNPPPNQASQQTLISSAYSYDVNGNRLTESLSQRTVGVAAQVHVHHNTTGGGTGGVVPIGGNVVTTTTTYTPYDNTTSYEAATATYDELNRITSFSDSGIGGTAPANITYEYDAVGNKRHVTTSYKDLTSNTTASQDFWFRYDSLDRLVVSEGQLSGARGASGTTIVRGSTGTEISWDVGSERRTAVGPNDSESYSYYNDGYLQNVYIDLGDGAGPVLRASDTRDLLGRVTSHIEKNSNGSTAFSRTASYDNAGNVTSDSVSTLQSDGSTVIAQNSTYDYGQAVGTGFNGGYQGGAITHRATNVYKNNVYQNTSDTKNLYVWWDTAKQQEIDYKPDVNVSTTNISNFTYDVNGFLQSVYIHDGNQRSETYTNDLSGKVIDRQENNTKTLTDPHEHYYYFNGVRVGDNGNNGPSNTDYRTAITQRSLAPSTSNDFTTGSASPYANFDQSYVPIDPNTDTPVGTNYTASGGETLQSVAQAVWGDSSLWYLIADANGLKGSDTLAAGQALVIPNKVTNLHNTSKTFQPYDPNQVLGDVQPTTPVQPPQHHGCGIIGQILLTVIAVTVSVLTAGTLGPVAAAVLGSVISQGIGVATGIQDHFSWAAVGLAAVGAVVGGLLGPVGDLAEGLNGVEQVAVHAAVAGAGNLITQGIGVATGLQDKFDWAGVGAAAAAAGATTAVSEGLSAESTTSQQFDTIVSGAAGTIASAAARSLIDGTDFGENLAGGLAGFAGETIGNAIGGKVKALAATGDRTSTTLNDAGLALPGQGIAGLQTLNPGDADAFQKALDQIPADQLAITQTSRVEIEPESISPVIPLEPVDQIEPIIPDAAPIGRVPVPDAVYSASTGDNVEKLARQFYGDQYKAGVAAIIDRNGIKTNSDGSPLIYAGQDYVIPSLDGIDTVAAARQGGKIIADNSQRLSAAEALQWESGSLVFDSLPARPSTPDPFWAAYSASTLPVPILRADDPEFGGLTIDPAPQSSAPSDGYPAFRASHWWETGYIAAVNARQRDAFNNADEALFKLSLANQTGLDNPAGMGLFFSGGIQLVGSGFQFDFSSLTGGLDQLGAWSHDRDSPAPVDRQSTDFLVTMGMLLSGGEVLAPEAAAAEVGVPAFRSANALAPVREFDAFGNEIFYRAMTKENFATLELTGRVTKTGETFISPIADYSAKYDGVLVRITVKPGTAQQLEDIAVTGNAATTELFPELPPAVTVSNWTKTNAMLKLENNGSIVTTGLGRGTALRIFNQNIIKFEQIPK